MASRIGAVLLQPLCRYRLSLGTTRFRRCLRRACTPAGVIHCLAVPETFVGDVIQPNAQETEQRREAVLRQMEHILASRLFKHSKRCGPLLRYVVLETLDGRGEYLKERAIGADVFGRKLTYDTSLDPIVRTTASEVRKRIAQYYHEFGQTATVRIDLSSGSYVPEFGFVDPADPAPLMITASANDWDPPKATAATKPTHQEDTALLPLQEAKAPDRKFRRIWVLAILPVLCVGTWLAWGPAKQAQDPLQRFWDPFWQTNSVTFAMGGGILADPEPLPGRQPQSAQEALNADQIGFVDAAAMLEVARLFWSRGKEFNLRRGGTLTLEEIRKTPVVLIGSNNPWTTRLMSSLRFYIEYSPPYSIALRDRQKPNEKLFRADLSATPAVGHTLSYAIISRFVDRLTEHPVIILAGLGKEGTIAAGEFATQPKYLALLDQRAPKGWNKGNLQIVISAEVINGNSGPPVIVAIHSW